MMPHMCPITSWYCWFISTKWINVLSKINLEHPAGTSEISDYVGISVISDSLLVYGEDVDIGSFWEKNFRNPKISQLSQFRCILCNYIFRGSYVGFSRVLLFVCYGRW